MTKCSKHVLRIFNLIYIYALWTHTLHLALRKWSPGGNSVLLIEIDVRALKERGLGHVVRVKLSGDACNHTHEWQLLDLTWDSMEISNLYFSYITFHVFLFITKIIHDI